MAFRYLSIAIVARGYKYLASIMDLDKTFYFQVNLSRIPPINASGCNFNLSIKKIKFNLGPAFVQFVPVYVTRQLYPFKNKILKN